SAAIRVDASESESNITIDTVVRRAAHDDDLAVGLKNRGVRLIEAAEEIKHDFSALAKASIERAARVVTRQSEIKAAAGNVRIKINCTGDDDLAVRLEHDGTGCSKVATKTGRECATITETRVRTSVTTITRQCKDAWIATATRELCKTGHDDPAVRLDSDRTD